MLMKQKMHSSHQYGCPDKCVGDQTSMSKNITGDRGGGAGLQPLLDGSSLISVPICCNDWVNHPNLHAQSY